MSSKIPVFRPVSIFGVILLIFVFSLIVMFGFFVGGKFSPGSQTLVGIAVALCLIGLYMAFVRWFFLADFNKGLRLLQTGKSPKVAITLFERFLLDLDENSWIDHWRFLVLLSPAAITYREMSLVNIAYCYGQTGEREKSKAYYEDRKSVV